MSSVIDKVPFADGERYKAADLNTLQDVLGRALCDALGFDSYLRSPSTSAGSVFADSLSPCVIGGLAANASGSNLSIDVGAALLPDAGAQAERPLSQLMMAVNAAPATVALPAPGANTWYLVVAALSQASDAAVSRDVFNPGTESWTPTNLVKRVRNSIAFSLITGTSTQLPTTTLTPICGVFRPAGGGAVLSSHIIDLRPSRPAVGSRVQRGEILRNAWRTNDWANAATQLTISTAVKARFVGELGLVGTVNIADHLDPSNAAPAAREWWYLYLAPYAAASNLMIAPRHAYALEHQGVLVISSTAPTDDNENGNLLTLPAPFSNVTVPAGRAVCFGAIQKPAAGSGWRSAYCFGQQVWVPIANRDCYPTFLSPGAASAEGDVPINAKCMSGTIELTSVSSGAPALFLINVGATPIRLVQFIENQLGDRFDVIDLPIGVTGTKAMNTTQFSGSGTPNLFLQVNSYRF